jgi:hypothetical protein
MENTFMIPTPQLSQLPFDLFVFAGAGYVFGRLNSVNERLLTGVLAVASIANHILFQIVSRWINPKLNEKFELNFSSGAVYTGTNAVVMIATLIAAQQLELLSRNWAGVLIFGSLAIFAARLRVLAAG